MYRASAVSRRGFVGGLATALGTLGSAPARWPGLSPLHDLHPAGPTDDYDALAKLGNNENPYGPPDSVLQAMTTAFKYANRYGYPDGGIVTAIASHHGVSADQVMLGAGSGEILDVCCTALLQNGRKVVGSDPSYNILFNRATSVKADAIKVPLLSDYRQDIPGLIAATRANARDVGFVYLCNPNNPTGRLVTKAEVRLFLDSIPEDVPVLIDEAYHHFVDDASYGTSVEYAMGRRPIIVTRTFSKIAGLAGMRLGYGLAPRDFVQQLRPWATGSISAVVKWGAVAALADTASQERVKRLTIQLREKTSADLRALGYDVIPSDTNFFMVHVRRQVQPVIEAFREHGVIVGRAFPPMTEHVRVSVGTADEMQRFMTAFTEIVAQSRPS
ncbi:MAG: aminotransferase class I/II-fold pyridoxal phosphate-dependent enzyme [Gemmatimonadaceae bacterium]